MLYFPEATSPIPSLVSVFQIACIANRIHIKKVVRIFDLLLFVASAPV